MSVTKKEDGSKERKKRRDEKQDKKDAKDVVREGEKIS